MADTTDPIAEWCMNYRGVCDPCTRCRGTGVKTYASTSTWRGGMGGCAMTTGECDHCWGSGDEHMRWTDRRKELRERESQIALRSVTHLADMCGVQISSLRPSIEALCDALDVLASKRKLPTHRFDLVCSQLAKALRASLEAHAEYRAGLEARRGREP